MKVGHIRDYFIRGILKTDTFQKVHENIMPMNELMAYYRCAIMEVETKFKVLNEEFSLQYDRNPIETIKSRLKSADGIVGELCWSDDPDYTVGYVACNGVYHRLPNMKEFGSDIGGRVFFVRSDIDSESVIEYLERTPVLVQRR